MTAQTGGRHRPARVQAGGWEADPMTADLYDFLFMTVPWWAWGSLALVCFLILFWPPRD